VAHANVLGAVLILHFLFRQPVSRARRTDRCPCQAGRHAAANLVTKTCQNGKIHLGRNIESIARFFLSSVRIWGRICSLKDHPFLTAGIVLRTEAAFLTILCATHRIGSATAAMQNDLPQCDNFSPPTRQRSGLATWPLATLLRNTFVRLHPHLLARGRYSNGGCPVFRLPSF
jgi:hypothetical protein